MDGDRILLNAVNSVYVDGRVWFWGKNINGLFYIDLKRKMCRYVLKQPKTNITDVLVYSSCLAVDKEIYFSPFNSRYICVYDTLKKEANYYDIDSFGEMYHAVHYASWVYFVGTKRTIRINCRTKLVEELVDFSNAGIASSPCRVGDSLFSASTERGYINEYDMKTLKVIRHSVNVLDDILSAFCYYNNSVWMAGYKALYEWDPRSGKINKMELPDGCTSREGIFNNEPFRAGAVIGKCIWFSPYKMNSIIRFDGKEISVVDVLSDDEVGGEFLHKEKEDICLVIDKYMEDYKVSRICDINNDGTGLKRGTFVECNESDLFMDGIIKENHVFSLSVLLSGVCVDD